MRRPELDRFMEKFQIEPETGCWIWTAARWPDGYGAFRAGDGKVRAHRWSYVHHKGPIPDGLILDHLCRNPSCVNPEHLEAVTHQTNTLRGIGPAAIHAKKTRCDHGHEFTPENTYRGKFGRSCRRCQLDAYDSPKQPEYECAVCGDGFHRVGSGKRTPRFCSRRCAAIAGSAARWGHTTYDRKATA